MRTPKQIHLGESPGNSGPSKRELTGNSGPPKAWGSVSVNPSKDKRLRVIRGLEACRDDTATGGEIGRCRETATLSERRIYFKQD